LRRTGNWKSADGEQGLQFMGELLSSPALHLELRSLAALFAARGAWVCATEGGLRAFVGLLQEGGAKEEGRWLLTARRAAVACLGRTDWVIRILKQGLDVLGSVTFAAEGLKRLALTPDEFAPEFKAALQRLRRTGDQDSPERLEAEVALQPDNDN
jgi:hypothetical protein